jgi:2-keto-3-deoxy-6-phosphogluconate aldolase
MEVPRINLSFFILTNITVTACGGSWIANMALINSGQFDEITRRAKEALRIVREVREDVQ